MTLREYLIKENWIENTNKDFNGGGLDKEIGKAKYKVYLRYDNLHISVFVLSDPNELWSQCMRATLYNGKCSDIETFNYIFKLVANYE